MSASDKQYTYIVEHLDPELEAWSALEYKTIAKESKSAGSRFLLSSVPADFKLPSELEGVDGLEVEHKSVEELFRDRKGEVCLLDPKAEKELSPEDKDVFSVFLFGGILGDDPPRDRTSELRVKGFAGRRLGPVQMTTDTAVRVTRMVVQEGYELEKIPYADFPEIRVDEHESTEMPFRYVKKADGTPVMPDGMIDLIKKDSEKGLGDLL
ncbi:uncharacterized protein PV09_03744 [Verruconis gallopava]|uniref:Carboxypeptidase D n=1 Tax=Verruconis gallopava TaxID=253628 RepID=A0A0D2AFE3_9PEZI|nr:uncharacterized protein PV09_03744 [Verruconis gallopava]KIW05200.1 hypothetical protein PV09_03744 [Verruconis gallopava]